MKKKPTNTPAHTPTSTAVTGQDLLDAMGVTRDRALGLALDDCVNLRAELVVAQREIQTLKDAAEKSP